MQHRPDAAKQGQGHRRRRVVDLDRRVARVWNLLSVRGVLHLTPPQIFLAGAALSLAGTIYCVKLMPDSLMRLILWFLTKTIYRIRVEGRDNIPEKGGALFVCNHVSFVDAPLLMASTDRKIHFIMEKGYYELWWIKPFGGMLGLIPIASDLGPRELIESLQAASDSDSRRRSRLHFCRGTNHAHGRAERISSRLRAHHEKHGRANRADRARRRLGQHFQLRAREIFLEMAAPHFLSRHRALRKIRCRQRRRRMKSRPLLKNYWPRMRRG